MLETATVESINASDTGALTSEKLWTKVTAKYDPRIEPRLRQRQAHAGPELFPEYQLRLLRMYEFRELLVDFMDKNSLDAMVYPLQKRN